MLINCPMCGKQIAEPHPKQRPMTAADMRETAAKLAAEFTDHGWTNAERITLGKLAAAIRALPLNSDQEG